MWINIMQIHMILWIHIYNDVGAFSTDWNHHAKLLATILCWLRKMALSLAQSHGGQRNWLAWIMAYTKRFNTVEKENIDAILHMDWPCNATELCMFIGYVNYYCTCCRATHKPLNQVDPWFDNLLHEQTKGRKHFYNVFAYHGYKSIAFPDHDKWFSIHTNASDFQLGMCIILERRPVAYFSCNLRMLQQSFTLEQQTLSIIATLKEFWGMLFKGHSHFYGTKKSDVQYSLGM
jgi:hypothetical protein